MIGHTRRKKKISAPSCSCRSSDSDPSRTRRSVSTPDGDGRDPSPASCPLLHKFEPQADNSQPEPSPCGDGSGSHVSLCPISTFHLPHGSVIAGWDSVQVSVRMLPVRLALCDLEAPGWGEPWFPHCAFVASWLTDYCMAFL